MPKAVLLDIGGPIFDEDEAIQKCDHALWKLLKVRGIRVSMEQIQAARGRAIESYAPSYLRATIWYLVKPDLELYEDLVKKVGAVFESHCTKIRPETVSVLNTLVRKYKLALAANQPREIKEFLRAQGLLTFFQLDLLPAELGFHKPDPRFFVAILEKLKLAPQEAVMVGDRLDNDVWPAKIVGIKTVRLLVGPHVKQEPRTPSDMPDATIDNLSELPAAIESLR
jgi:HAD superfamily hydrolase (TIGR01549 family)